MKGIVIRNTGSNALVRTISEPEPRILNCRVKGNFRIKGLRTTNPVAVGDIVDITDTGADDALFITAIQPRRNYIIRRASNLSKESHIIAANIDSALLIISLSHPTTSTTFIDRFLATAEAYNVPVTIVINKIDLLTDPDQLEFLDAVAYLYRSIGYNVCEVSATDGRGIAELRRQLDGKITLLSGNSGVGKSTLINRLIPGLNQRTAEVSAIHDTGMHTTTFSEMFQLPDSDGYIIDTPGVKGFGTIDFDPAEVSHFFPEIFEIGQDCRYNNCTHTHEPGCAVIRALDDHRIAQSRYNSYLSILDDTKPDKYRKPF